jgi:hypothetical protein
MSPGQVAAAVVARLPAQVVVLASRDPRQEQERSPEPHSNPPGLPLRPVHSLAEEQTAKPYRRSSNSAPVPQAEANFCIRS